LSSRRTLYIRLGTPYHRPAPFPHAKDTYLDIPQLIYILNQVYLLLFKNQPRTGQGKAPPKSTQLYTADVSRRFLDKLDHPDVVPEQDSGLVVRHATVSLRPVARFAEFTRSISAVFASRAARSCG
jgi:hypothetical protein